MNTFINNLDKVADKFYIRLIELQSQNNPKNKEKIEQLQKAIKLIEQDIQKLKGN